MSTAVHQDHQPENFPAPVIFTDSAASKVKELIDEENNPKLNLRLYIKGGGCSGFEYKFNFDETIKTDDMVIEKVVQAAKKDDGKVGEASTVKLLIDSMSLQYLMGAEIDYKEDLDGEQFVIRNPNAKTTCGCGSSFAA